MLAVARNIASRAQSGADGRFHLRGVVPPDEHVLDHHVGAPVDDSVMTNAYAAWCLRVAADDASVAPYEACRWRDIADRMHLPRDDARGLWLEYEGYDGHPIKQADVAHLWWPLRFNDDADDIRRNCAYYLAREDETALHLMHGIAAYGVAAARAADVAGVARAWRGSARNRVGPYEMPTESDWNSGAPYVASAGSFLCLLQYGALGIDTQGERFAARPCLPPEIGRIALGGIRFRGERWRVAATPGEPAQLTRAAAAGGGR